MRRTTGRRRQAGEHEEQKALFGWAALMERQMPALKNLFAVPNGGKRDLRTAMRLKREGVRPGVPDVFLDWPSGGYHGLRIELKYGKNKPTPAQDDWHARLRIAGYLVVVCWGWVEARTVIEAYLAPAGGK